MLSRSRMHATHTYCTGTSTSWYQESSTAKATALLNALVHVCCTKSCTHCQAYVNYINGGDGFYFEHWPDAQLTPALATEESTLAPRRPGTAHDSSSLATAHWVLQAHNPQARGCCCATLMCPSRAQHGAPARRCAPVVRVTSSP